VLVEKKDPITTIIINRPEVHNAADLESRIIAFSDF